MVVGHSCVREEVPAKGIPESGLSNAIEIDVVLSDELEDLGVGRVGCRRVGCRRVGCRRVCCILSSGSRPPVAPVC